MTTQRTGMGGGPPGDGSHPVRPGRKKTKQRRGSGKSVLDIPDETTYVPDPGGFEPEAPAQELAGRKVRRVSPGELMQQHQDHAGDVGLHGNEIPSIDTEMRRRQQQQRDEEAGLADSPPGPPASKADAMTPDWLRRKEAEARMASTRPQPTPDRPGGGSPAGGAPPGGRRPPGGDDPSTMVAALLSEAERARDDGDPILALRLQKMAEAAIGDARVRRISDKPQSSEILGRLRRNLGLKRIDPVTVEWGGSKWHFAPVPPTLDYWLYAQLPTDGLTRTMWAPALGISISIVGLDNTPLWKVLNLPIRTTYEFETAKAGEEGEEGEAAGEEGEEQPPSERIDIGLHVKRCPGCTVEVGIEDKQCGSCDAVLDPFDVPVSLRLQYAERFYEWLQNEFGPFEKLADLWAEMNTVLPNRSTEQENLYPLLDWSTSQPETPTSPSGGE